MEEQAKRKYVDPLDVAVIYAAIGDKDRAFAQLEGVQEKGTAVLVSAPGGACH